MSPAACVALVGQVPHHPGQREKQSGHHGQTTDLPTTQRPGRGQRAEREPGHHQEYDGHPGAMRSHASSLLRRAGPGNAGPGHAQPMTSMARGPAAAAGGGEGTDPGPGRVHRRGGRTGRRRSHPPAPLAKLQGYAASRGWSVPWYSSYGSDFNYDFQLTLDKNRSQLDYTST